MDDRSVVAAAAAVQHSEPSARCVAKHSPGVSDAVLNDGRSAECIMVLPRRGKHQTSREHVIHRLAYDRKYKVHLHVL